MVFRAAFRILGSSAEAEDVTQDVFLEVFSRAALEEVQNWGAYLHRLAVYRALDLRRKRCQAVPLEDDGFPTAELSPHDEAVRRELADRLRDRIADLPDREGAVFALRYLEGLSNPRIAETLGISIGAVAAALHKVRLKLEAALAETPKDFP
jgi:RNA polymerase sigma-70 factor (ECF subfamily)